MRPLGAFFSRLASFFRKSSWERDMSAELEANLQLNIEDNIRAGMAPEAARREAILTSGGLDSAKEAYRDRKSLPFLDMLMQDLRYSARAFRNHPGFAVVAVATLALGIGATTAMFSMVEAVLLRPLPYSEPNRLVEISETNPLKGWTRAVAAPANFADWRRMNSVFTGIAGYTGSSGDGESYFNVFMTGDGEPMRLKALGSTGNLFEVLGAKPFLGRIFAEEETYDGKDHVAILSYDFWQTTFAADPRTIGRSIQLGGVKYEVVGVMPAGFFFPSHEVQLYIPLGLKPSTFTNQRRPHWLQTIARLRPGVSIGQATGEMTAIATRLEQMYPETNTKMGIRLDGFHSTLTESHSRALLLLLGAVFVLFLIVCSNVANLQLGRAAARVQEISIRMALGAGRVRLTRQLLTESLLLSVTGGALGFALAVVARAGLIYFAPQAIPKFAELRVDAWVILFCVAVTLGAPLIFGLVPALTATRANTLRSRVETGSRGTRTLRDILVASEVAFSVLLVVGAGLLIRTLIQLESVDPGFKAEGAISFHLSVPSVRYPKVEQQVATLQRIEDILRAQPGVLFAGAALTTALHGTAWTGDATPEGRPAGEYERELNRDVVTPDYFSAMGIRLLRGRFFSQFDAAKSPLVTIVNETCEKKYFRGESAIGKRIKFGRPKDSDENSWVTVVGVVADVKQTKVDERVAPEAYAPLAQEPQGGLTFVVRTSADPEAIVATARREVRAIDKDLTLTDVTTLREIVYDSVGNQRFRASLLSGFAGIALFLAALGVYGVLAYSVAQRSREIGIRMALGASIGGLFGMVVRDGMRPVLLGSIAGLAGAYAVGGAIQSLLFGVAAVDPGTYLLTVAILATVAIVACSVPALKAIRVNPLSALREQ